MLQVFFSELISNSVPNGGNNTTDSNRCNHRSCHNTGCSRGQSRQSLGQPLQTRQPFLLPLPLPQSQYRKALRQPYPWQCSSVLPLYPFPRLPTLWYWRLPKCLLEQPLQCLRTWLPCPPPDPEKFVLIRRSCAPAIWLCPMKCRYHASVWSDGVSLHSG